MTTPKCDECDVNFVEQEGQVCLSCTDNIYFTSTHLCENCREPISLGESLCSKCRIKKLHTKCITCNEPSHQLTNHNECWRCNRLREIIELGVDCAGCGETSAPHQFCLSCTDKINREICLGCGEERHLTQGFCEKCKTAGNTVLHQYCEGCHTRRVSNTQKSFCYQCEEIVNNNLCPICYGVAGSHSIDHWCKECDRIYTKLYHDWTNRKFGF